MIGKLTGTIDSFSGSHVILDVNGVGYVVTCSSRTLRQMGPVKSAGDHLLIETHVREDAINLYGFADTEEQDWFKLLTTVQGVGAKVALSILGSLAPEQLAQVIAAQDKAAMTQADGVGPKLALRLVTELKDKVPAFMASPIPLHGAKGKRSGSVAKFCLPAMRFRHSSISATAVLEAFAAVATVSRQNPSAKLDGGVIRLSLAELSRKDSAA